MKYLTLLALLLIIVCESCTPIVEDSRIVSFWTDITLNEDTEYSLVINDMPVGIFYDRYDEVSCGIAGMINVDQNEGDDMILQIVDSNGDTVKIGHINIYAPSSGISVHEEGSSSIFVKREIDEPCSLVRLRW